MSEYSKFRNVIDLMHNDVTRLDAHEECFNKTYDIPVMETLKNVYWYSVKNIYS
jgi:hypothetical protein